MAKTLAFFVCVFLWLILALGVIFAPEALDAFWESVRGLPWWLEGPIWFLTLPWMIGLWVWQSSWDLWLRLVLLVGVALANLVSFNPWTQSQEFSTPRLPLTPKVGSANTGSDPRDSSQRESDLTKV